MTLPGMMPFGGLAAGGIIEMSLVDHTAANNTTVSYPSNIQAGDLLVGLSHTGSSTTFRSASGFTSQVFYSSAGSSCLCTKIADGTETGAIGGFTGTTFPLAEACVVMRPSRPIFSVTKLLSGAYRAPGDTSTLSLAGSGTNTAKPRFAIFAFGADTTFNNGNISFNGTGFHSQNYVEGTVRLKSRTSLWPAGETGQDIDAIKYDTGGNNTVFGAFFELT